MPEALIAFALAIAALLGWMFRPRKARPRYVPPEGWRATLRTSVPQARLVPADLQALYERQVERFLREKRFVGCNGLVVDDEMRIAIAGLACLLVLRPQAGVFPLVHDVLIYPDRFFVTYGEPDELGLVSDDPVEQLGESWEGERVILSWADIDAALHGDEVNVVAHEFAHQLDDETPETEGAPALRDYTRWSEVMQREFKRLQRHRRPPVLDPYGAESPGEFFGVVTEAFFQRGVELRRHHAELYDLLRDYYRLDPAQQRLWTAVPTGEDR
ncbi:M90 family metallopeptidase [Fontimonas sp. SYSU GA230001]|uniref:M90 family metallopeptidase n=1 Tax=Fontimonas sp. SYSU GA230001 TaxID=3142450 RepID=UPI0032B38E5F